MGISQVPAHQPSSVWAGYPELELSLGSDAASDLQCATPRTGDSAADPGSNATQVQT